MRLSKTLKVCFLTLLLSALNNFLISFEFFVIFSKTSFGLMKEFEKL